MTDPQDAIPDPVHSSDYWTGYYEGKRAALHNGEVIARINSIPARTGNRTGKWGTAGFWLLVVAAGAAHLIEYLFHDYTRINAFEDGIVLTILMFRLSRPRYPR